MNYFVRILVLGVLFTCSLYAKVSPSEVFIEAKAIKVALASQVVKQKGVSLLPIMDIDLRGAEASSVYSMAAALNYKLQVYAQINKKKWKGSPFPSEQIKPKHVRDVLYIVKENIANIFGISSFKSYEITSKTPADVMKELTYANQWLDKLMPFVKPQYTLATLDETQKILNRIYEKYSIPFFDIKVKKHKKITPNDVFINVTASYNLLRILKFSHSKKSSPSHPYDILSAKDKIVPLDIFTITSINLFMLYSSALDMGIKDIDTTGLLKIKPNIKPNDIFLDVDIINSKIANLIASGGRINVK